ncbi:hypothetical protein [Isosphaera pallida]|nr:hypothetical protein [Isosphaera pallida]
MPVNAISNPPCPPGTALARREFPSTPIDPEPLEPAFNPQAIAELEQDLFPHTPEPRPWVSARWIDSLVLLLAIVALIPKWGWNGLVLTNLGLGQEQMLILLGSPMGLGGILAIGPYWLWRSGAWGAALENAFWRKDLNHKALFLLPYFAMPVGVMAALLVGRLLWDRVPLEAAGRSHARLLRLGWAAAIFGSLALLTYRPIPGPLFIF